METLEIDFKKMFGGFYRGKNVLVTGHTGFKGSWLSLWLYLMGARVIGYALDPATDRDNFVLCGLRHRMMDIRGDIRDDARLKQVFSLYEPEIVFHLAAQPIVRRSYEIPDETFETNVMGTVRVLENIRLSGTVKTGVIVTSDKCYDNKEQFWGYREGDMLGGYDPYSASKSCAEIVTASYRNSFYNARSGKYPGKCVSSVRAGNVVGGGDWSECRLIPDSIRALQSQNPIEIRNPDSVRPWQHVLEPLYGYLLLAYKMAEEGSQYAGAWNFGPDFDSIVPVSRVADMLVSLWGSGKWVDCAEQPTLHEAALLSLDCTKAKTFLGWKPRMDLQKALEYTVEWYQKFRSEDVYHLCRRQISAYCAACMSAEESLD
nr:CDP-glucose 4,6-dehydratase [uncultured Caproiciproducens sp.]